MLNCSQIFLREFAIAMYFIGFLISTTTNTLPKESFIPSLFCQVHTHQISIGFRPNSSFSPHQLSIHYRLEGIYYHQHSETHPLVQFLSITNHPKHIQSTSSLFFPDPAQIWRTHIEFLSHYFTDPFATVYPDSVPSPLDDL